MNRVSLEETLKGLTSCKDGGIWLKCSMLSPVRDDWNNSALETGILAPATYWRIPYLREMRISLLVLSCILLEVVSHKNTVPNWILVSPSAEDYVSCAFNKSPVIFFPRFFLLFSITSFSKWLQLYSISLHDQLQRLINTLSSKIMRSLKLAVSYSSIVTPKDNMKNIAV